MEFLQIPLEGNEQALLKLYQDVYADTPDRIPSLEELHWRFGGHLHPVRIWVACEAGNIVGLRPLALHTMQLGKSVYPALHMLNVMVHPAYQGKGVFRSLMSLAWEKHGEEGVLAFTYPNENSTKAYRKWKEWFRLAELPLYIRMIPPKQVSEEKSLARFIAGYGAASARTLRFNKPIANGMTVQLIDALDEGIDALWQNNRHSFDLMIPREKAYLTWRYVERPDVQYKMYKGVVQGRTVGYLVARTRIMFGMHLGLIVDFFVENNERALLSALIQRASADLIEQGVHAIGLQFIGPDSLKRSLWDNGFFAVPKQLLPREFPMFARRGGLIAGDVKSISDCQGMFFTWGDNDAV